MRHFAFATALITSVVLSSGCGDNIFNQDASRGDATKTSQKKAEKTATKSVAKTPEKAPKDTKIIPAKSKNPVVVIKTSMGEITAELWMDKAPLTVKNFLAYTKDEFYDGKIFHRVIRDFMIQGGGFTPNMKQPRTRDAIKNEARADVKNDRGTLAMARTQIIDSATAQFFINLKDNKFLNHRSKTMRGFGYCVFGKVIKGMDIVDKIAIVPTGTRGRYDDVPVKPVVINSIRVAK